MSTQPHRFLNVRPVLDEATDIATEFVSRQEQQNGRNKTEAIAATAAACGVTASAIRAIVQPSRKPKRLDADLWQRLRRAYVAYLRQQLGELENEIARVEALGPGDRSVRDLLAKAEAVADRLRHLLR